MSVYINCPGCGHQTLDIDNPAGPCDCGHEPDEGCQCRYVASGSCPSCATLRSALAAAVKERDTYRMLNETNTKDAAHHLARAEAAEKDARDAKHSGLLLTEELCATARARDAARRDADELAAALKDIREFLGVNFEWADMASEDKWLSLRRPTDKALSAHAEAVRGRNP